MEQETVVSGIRPTGKLHLGNYFGAIKNAVELQANYSCYFFVADYHSLTTHPTPENLKQNIKEVLSTYLACGLDPEKSVIYLQSDLPEIPELYLLLNMIAYKGELERSTTYKEKVQKQKENINAGLLTYPVLMAADIIIHKAKKVPVGKDQQQHLEMTRNFVNRFNHLYNCECFPEPFAVSWRKDLIKIPGLDGSGKMGKSEGEGNAIFLKDDDKVIRKKIMRAVTDTGPEKENQPVSEPVQHLFTLMDVVSEKEIVDKFREDYSKARIRYGDMKKQLAEDMITFITPIREKIFETENDQGHLNKVIKDGAERAKESASATIREVREVIGLNYFQ